MCHECGRRRDQPIQAVLGAEPFEGREGAETGTLALCLWEREKCVGLGAPYEASAETGLTRWPETRA